jgi:hypothetical protein
MKGKEQMSKRVWLLPALAILLVAVGGSAAFAVPSLGGPSGIVSVPNALVAPTGQAAVAASWQSMSESLNLYGISDSGDFSTWSLQVLGGVAEGAELWAAYSSANDVLDTTTWGVGGKFQFAREPESPVTLAVGGAYRSGSGDAHIAEAVGMYASVDQDVTSWNAYLAASKDFTPTGLTSEWAKGTRIVGTAGVLWANRNLDLKISGESFSPDDTLLEPFVAVEFLGTEGTTLGLEYRWKDSDIDQKAVFSAVLRQCFPNGFFGEIGTTNADQFGFGLDNQNFFARAGYAFTFGGGY